MWRFDNIRSIDAKRGEEREFAVMTERHHHSQIRAAVLPMIAGTLLSSRLCTRHGAMETTPVQRNSP